MKEIVMELNLVGYDKNNIKIDYDGKNIIVTAEKMSDKYGHIKYSKKTRVGKIDRSQISATYDGSILKVYSPVNNKFLKVNLEDGIKEQSEQPFNYDDIFGTEFNKAVSDMISFDPVFETLSGHETLHRNNKELARLKDFINTCITVNDIRAFQDYLVDYSKSDIVEQFNHKLTKELQRNNISYMFYSLINLHYHKVFVERELYDTAEKVTTMDAKPKLIKAFVIESVLDDIILTLNSKGMSQKTITTIISNYLNNNGKLSEKVKAYISDKEIISLIEKLNTTDIISLLNIYGFTKISEYVSNVFKSDYIKPYKKYSK